ncbi:MAG: DUF58 domain-containing protein [candidate division GAL15 bacterium]
MLLEPAFLEKLERLRLVVRRRMRGSVGERRSRALGRGVEFSDHRAYQVGDDWRYVDWSIYARLDRLFVKLFEEEEDTDVHLLLDASASMRFGSPSKLEYAKRLAAALGYVALANGDRVGAAAVHAGMVRTLPPRRGRAHAYHLFRFLEAEEAHGTTELEEAAKHFAPHRRGLVVALGDLLDPRGFQGFLKRLRHAGLEVFVVHLLAEEDLAPPQSGELRLVDAETGESVEVTVDEQLLRAFASQRDAFLEEARAFCARAGMAYVRATTALPVEDVVLRYLRQAGVVA